MVYLFDYHMHSTNSIDGKSSVMDLCQRAVDIGLKEIAITDHFEPSIGDENASSYNQKAYWSEMQRAKQTFRKKLKLKLGVEIGQPHLFKAATDNILEGLDYDYVLASAHKLPNGLDVSQLDFKNIKPEALSSMYIEQLKELVTFDNFDCIGHLDLIKRYSTASYNMRISLTMQYEMLEELLKLIIQNNKGIEINTSGLRQSPKETMPGIDVLTLYRQLGGEILTIGSDAHHADDVGKNIFDAYQLAEQAGFRYVTTFNKRAPEWHKITVDNSFYSYYNSKAINR